MAKVNLSEERFMEQVIDLALMNGWLVHHDRANMTLHTQGHPGFPDLVLAHAARKTVIFAELKVGKNVVTSAQLIWLRALEMATPKVWVFTWYPADMPTIQRILTGRG